MFLFRWHGKPTEIGFGSARDVTLAHARELAGQASTKLAQGINPKDARKPSEGATFGECADQVIEAMRPSWRNAKHAAQWEMTLRDYAAPLRRLPVDKITTDDMLSVLKPLWREKPETASRLRGRIERVLDAAKAQGLRSGENPARWRGHLDQLLPKRQQLTRGHHAAMNYTKLPAFIGDLRKRQATASLALEFAILTAFRQFGAGLPCQFSCTGKCYITCRTEADFGWLAMPAKEKHPPPTTVWRNRKIKPATVSMTAELCDRRYQSCIQAIDFSCHCPAPSAPTCALASVPDCSGRWRAWKDREGKKYQ